MRKPLLVSETAGRRHRAAVTRSRPGRPGPILRRRRNRMGLAAAGAAAAATAMTPVAAHADPTSSLQAQAHAATDRLSALDAQLASLDEQINTAQAQVDSLQQQVAQARAAEAAAAARLNAARARLRTHAVNAYLVGGQVPAVEELMSSTENQAIVRQTYVKDLTGDELSAIDAVRRAQDAYKAQEAQLSAAMAKAQAALAAVDAARQAAAVADAAEKAQVASLQGQLAEAVAAEQAQQAQALEAKWSAAAGSSNPPPTGQGAATAVAWARQEVGKPYQYGAAGPDSFDCSGLTMYVWGKAGVSLPHSAQGQWDDTARVSYSQLQPGDLVFYYQPVNHVGIYVGNGQMITADTTGTPVRYASIWRQGLDGFGRVHG